MRAVQQEKEGSIYHLRGEAEIDYRTYILHADQITYNADTGDSELEGHVVLDGGPYDEHVEASHGTYNIRTQIGTFYSAIGTVGFRMRNSRYVLTTSNPFAFTGKIVEKHGPNHYLVRQGTVTTCELPHPKWLFSGRRISVDVDGTAKIYNSDFRLMGMPVFYFPFVTLPVQKEQRQTGLLIPSFGNSSTKGMIAGESVYWVFNRSTDATVGAEYYSKRGWFQRGEFRARPSDSSYVFFNYRGDSGSRYRHSTESAGPRRRRRTFSCRALFWGLPRRRECRLFEFVRLPHCLHRCVHAGDRFGSKVTDFPFQYDQRISLQCTGGALSELRSLRSDTGTGTADLQHDYADRVGPDSAYAKFLHLWRGAAVGKYAAVLVVRERGRGFAAARGPEGSQPLGSARLLVGRFDLAPSLAMPVQWQGWSFRPALTLRDTFYTERGQSGKFDGTAADDILNRKSLEASFEVRPPALSRVFDHPWLGRKWKHVIEPRMKYDYVTGVNNFADILHFDATDVLTNTNEVEYSLVNRLYAKHLDPNAKDCDVQGMSTLTIGGAPQVGAVPWEVPPNPDAQACASGPREILSWEIGQKYFFDSTFGNALVAGQRNVFTTTADFTGIAFLDSARRFAPLISRLRIETNPRTNTEWDLDYDLKDGRINSSMALVNYHLGAFTMGGGDAFLRVIDTGAGTTPTSEFNQFRLLFGYGQLNKRGLSAASSFGFDANLGSLQYATAQTSYTWDCCGLSLEFRRFALGAVRNENQYRFTFTLANIGAFGNLKRQERLY